MKKLLTILCAILLCAGVAYADKYTVDRSALPETARQMIEEYFPKAKVAMIKVDRHLLKKTDYDVRLTNGTKLEFNNAGKWTSVDCKSRAVPEGLVPAAIRRYVKKNLDNVTIVKIEKNYKGYEVKLADGVEAKFDLLGTFKSVKLDDDDGD